MTRHFVRTYGTLHLLTFVLLANYSVRIYKTHIFRIAALPMEILWFLEMLLYNIPSSGVYYIGTHSSYDSHWFLYVDDF